MRTLTYKKMTALLCALVLSALVVACGGDDQSKVSVSIYGFDRQGTEGQFVMGLPDFEGANEMHVRVTQPADGVVIKDERYNIAARNARLPALPLGEGLRLDFEVHGAQGVVASGNTPTFDFGDRSTYRAFRTLISPVNDFAPVGSMVRIEGSNEQRLVQSRFDGRAIEGALGRVGHTATPTSTGKVLVVGGGEVGAFHQPATVPNLQRTFADIQLFDPATGYFTELAGDDAARQNARVGEDRLRRSRAFHSVTDLGNDRFLVAGGFEVVGNSLQASRSIEIIDLNAPAGLRIQQLNDVSGTPIRLNTGRALHTATLRESDGRVVIVGGLTADNGAVANTFEVINTNPHNAVIEGGLAMQASRVGHSAVLLEDGEGIWIIGGRSQDGVHDSTELITVGEGGNASQASARLSRARYAASATPIGNGFVAVFGGFTGLTSGATAAYELGRPSDANFQSQSDWRLKRSRGGASLFVLPQTGDVILIGGLNPDREIVDSVERLRFLGFGALSPFFVDDAAGSMYQQRGGFAAAEVTNGRYLLVGGQARDEGPRSDAEYFNPLDAVR